jgi:glycosyltransferase involved in cell wall biosynthesis
MSRAPHPLHVAFVMSGLGVVRRGAEAFVEELATRLEEQAGIEVEMYCRGEVALPHRSIRSIPRDQPALVRLYEANRWSRKGLDTLFLDPLSVEWYTSALSALPGLLASPPSVLVMEGGLLGASIARLLRAVAGVPFVDIAHGVDPKWEGAFARQKPDRVVTFTESAARALRQLAPRAAITTIPHGIDLERFAPLGQPVALDIPRPVVLVAGSLDPHKRVELAIEAVGRLKTASLVVLGEGPSAESLDRQAATQLPGRYLRRAVDRAEMPAWYRAADCFTLPSRTESFGLTYLEAMACGVPVVAPDDATRREVLADAGVFCDVTESDAYARALTAAISMRGSPQPRRRAEEFPIARTVASYAALFRALAKRAGNDDA